MLFLRRVSFQAVGTMIYYLVLKPSVCPQPAARGDGRLVWKITTPRPPNSSPAVGYVKNFPGLSIVMPVCQQVGVDSTGAYKKGYYEVY